MTAYEKMDLAFEAWLVAGSEEAKALWNKAYAESQAPAICDDLFEIWVDYPCPEIAREWAYWANYSAPSL